VNYRYHCFWWRCPVNAVQTNSRHDGCSRGLWLVIILFWVTSLTQLPFISDLDEDDSPSKVSNSGGRPEALQPLSARGHPSSNAVAGSSKDSSPRRVFSRTYSHRPSASPGRSFAKANGTFLTECSFGVAHDRLVEVITDVQPFEPHWDELSSIDLSNAKLESVARLKEFLPRLDALSL